jgi:DNA-binding phage protein
MSNDRNETPEEHWMLLVLLLKEVADQRGISQEQLAEMSGLKQSNISRMFSLKYCPNLRTYLRVSKALQLNVFFETRDADDDLTQAFERAMSALGRRPDDLPKN